MNLKQLSLVLLSLSLFGFSGCGKDSEESAANGAAVEYFAQFVSHENGIQTGNTLECNAHAGNGYNSYNTNGAVVKLNLDANGSYFLYAEYSGQSVNDGRTMQGVNGTWKIEGDRVVLDGAGQSYNYTQNQYVYNGYNQVQVQRMDNTCFTVQLSADMNLPINGNYVYNGNYGNSVQIPSNYMLEICRK